MGFFTRLGKKMSDFYETGHRIGSKVLGETARIGGKISSVGGDIVSAIQSSPLGVPLATPLAGASKVLQGIGKVSEMAGKGAKLLGDVDNVVRKGMDTMNKVEKHDAKRRAPQMTSSSQLSSGSLQHHPSHQISRGHNQGR